jgi:hypothetical protein
MGIRYVNNKVAILDAVMPMELAFTSRQMNPPIFVRITIRLLGGFGLHFSLESAL